MIPSTAIPAITIDALPTIPVAKTDFIDTIDDLFVYANAILGGYHSYANGNWSTNAAYASSGYVEVEPEYIYDCSTLSTNMGHLCFWDAHKNYVSGVNPLTKVGNVVTITVPANQAIKYMSFMTTAGQVASLKILPRVIYYKLSKQLKTDDVHNFDKVITDLKSDTTAVDNDLQAFKSQVGGGTVIGAQWSGKKWYAYGTSLTSIAQGKYVAPLAALSGMIVTNNGSGGACMHTIAGNLRSAGYADAELVTIEGSVNDYNTSVPIGQVGDTLVYNPTDLTGSFAGSVYSCIKNASERALGATIVLITDPSGHHPPGGGHFDPSAVNSLNLHQIDYINMLIAVGEYLGVPVIKAGQTSAINLFNPQYYIDHIHQSDLGGQQYANAIWDELKNIHQRKVV